jgi:hypothetical protein
MAIDKPITKLRGPLFDRVDLVDNGANQGAHIVLYKRDSSAETDDITKGGKIMDVAEIMKSLPEDQQAILKADFDAKDAAVAAAQAEVDVLKTAAEDAEKKKKDDEEAARMAELNKADTEDIWKGVNPAIKERVEKAEAAVAEAVAKTAAAEETIAKADFAKRAAELNALPIKPEEFGEVLRKISAAAPEQYTKLTEVLKSANEVIKSGKAFEEVGSGQVGEPKGLTAIEKKAEEIMKSEPTLTKEQAFVKAMERDPKLYTAAQADNV